VSNSTRTPRQGTNAHSRRIAQAVDNEDWQKFRVALKGSSTRFKLSELEAYWDLSEHDTFDKRHHEDCDPCIRVDNYLKALARGGQLYSGVSLQYALELGDITLLEIKRN
jgi:hypothetical protein